MKKNVRFEFSAGGIVKKDSEYLLILTKNLKGENVWTFPKGKIEKYETPQDAALREVWEETGYKCSITGDIRWIKYLYRRQDKLVIKKVKWFMMEVAEKNSEPDAEIIKTKWADNKTASDLLTYKLDHDILEKTVAV